MCWHLIEAQAEANLLWQVEFYVKVQANALPRLSMSDRFDAAYHGHGALAAAARQSARRRRRDDAGSGARKRAEAGVCLRAERDVLVRPAHVRVHGQPGFINTYATLAPPDSRQQTAALVNVLRKDVPRRWWQYLEEVEPGAPARERSAQRALRYATHQFVVLQAAARTRIGSASDRADPPRERAALCRCAGTGWSILRGARVTRVTFAAVEALYQEARTRNPNEWAAYRELAQLRINRGELRCGPQALPRVPAVHPGGAWSIASQMANGAAEQAGSMLFSRGAIAEAVPLYKIAADLHTGAESSLAASMRLKLLDGRFAEAAGDSLVRARRYHSAARLPRLSWRGCMYWASRRKPGSASMS